MDIIRGILFRMRRHEIVLTRICGFNIGRTIENTGKHIVFAKP